VFDHNKSMCYCCCCVCRLPRSLTLALQPRCWMAQHTGALPAWAPCECYVMSCYVTRQLLTSHASTVCSHGGNACCLAAWWHVLVHAAGMAAHVMQIGSGLCLACVVLLYTSHLWLSCYASYLLLMLAPVLVLPCACLSAAPTWHPRCCAQGT
jgi:hypothetical protein